MQCRVLALHIWSPRLHPNTGRGQRKKKFLCPAYSRTLAMAQTVKPSVVRFLWPLHTQPLHLPWHLAQAATHTLTWLPFAPPCFTACHSTLPKQNVADSKTFWPCHAMPMPCHSVLSVLRFWQLHRWQPVVRAAHPDLPCYLPIRITADFSMSLKAKTAWKAMCFKT